MLNTEPGTGRVQADLDWKEAILAGDLEAWHRFVNRYSNAIAETAIRWCDTGCRFTGGCPLRKGVGSPFQRFLRTECRCDRAGTAYCFILEKVREKLVFYRGERGCRLDTWVRRLLTPQGGAPAGDYGYRQLYADYVRRVEGRVRAPAEILRAEPLLAQVYLAYHYGREEREISESLSLTPGQLAATVARIEDVLRRNGAEYYWRFWGHLWLPRETASLGAEWGEEEAPEPCSRGGDPHTEWQAAAAQRAIREALLSLPPLTRHLLWLAIDEGLTAPQIAAELRSQDLARWSPRKVYTAIDRAVAAVCREVARALAPLDDVSLSTPEMKKILGYWSVGRFLARRPGGRFSGNRAMHGRLSKVQQPDADRPEGSDTGRRSKPARLSDPPAVDDPSTAALKGARVDTRAGARPPAR